MNPTAAGRTPNQANTYREQYVASLMLDISNMAKTLNASRGIVTTGSSGAPPVDGRTVTEKYADVDALKVMLRGQLKEITDGQNAQDIVYELTTNELEFLAGQIPFVISDLKPKWKLGIPAEAFIPYLRKLMRKNIETEGVDYGLQEGGGFAGGPGGGLPPPTINNLMPVQAFEQFMYDIDDILEMPEEGDLQSVGSFASSSLAPSEASSRYSQMPIDFGAQFGAPPASARIRPSILKMRDLLHRDMLRIIDNWPSAEDAAVIQISPDPYVVEDYQVAIAEFADTLPNLQQMEGYRDDLERAIGDGNQAQAEAIIKGWSAIVSNIDYDRMMDAKEIVAAADRQTKEANLGLREPIPEEDILDEDDLSSYFSQIQSAPNSVSSIIRQNEEEQSQGTPSVLQSIQEDVSVMTEIPPPPEGSIPVISYQEFRRLSERNKRDYLTLIGEILPNGALGAFFDEVIQFSGEPMLRVIDRVFPADEEAIGGSIDDLEQIYGTMLESETLQMRVNEVLISDENIIAMLPEELVNAVSPEKLPPMEPLISRAEFAARRGGPSAPAEITPATDIEGDITPFSGNGILRKCGGALCGKGMCGRGCGCKRCDKKMTAGKLPAGKGKNIIIGRGLLTPQKVTSKVVPSNIDLSAGVKAEPAYVSFGKHLINKHRLLKDDVLMLRTLKGGAILNVPTQKISRGLTRVLKTIIGGGNPDFDTLNVLTDGDKEVLYNISKTSRISHSVPNPNKSSQEQEDTRFEILKGQIASGQDNKEAIKEFKLLLIKMMNQRRIPKGQGIDILTEMAAQGL